MWYIPVAVYKYKGNFGEKTAFWIPKLRKMKGMTWVEKEDEYTCAFDFCSHGYTTKDYKKIEKTLVKNLMENNCQLTDDLASLQGCFDWMRSRRNQADYIGYWEMTKDYRLQSYMPREKCRLKK